MLVIAKRDHKFFRITSKRGLVKGRTAIMLDTGQMIVVPRSVSAMLRVMTPDVPLPEPLTE